MIKKLAFYCVVVLAATSIHAKTLSTERIVSVDANMTEILKAFDLEKNIVAVDMTSLVLIESREVPDLGYHRALSAEGILSMQPSIILGSYHMGPKPAVDTLKKSGVNLVQLKSAESVEGLIANINELGTLLAAEQSALELTDKISKKAEAINRGDASNPLTMVFIMELRGKGLSKAGAGTAGASFISMLGGQNIAQYAGYKAISIEALLEINPDVILVGSRGEEDAAKVLLANNPQLLHSAAVKNEKFYAVDANKMIAGVSVGLIDEAIRLSRLIQSK